MHAEAEEHSEQISKAVMQSSVAQQFLTPGRVVVVKSQSVSYFSLVLCMFESIIVRCSTVCYALVTSVKSIYLEKDALLLTKGSLSLSVFKALVLGPIFIVHAAESWYTNNFSCIFTLPNKPRENLSCALIILMIIILLSAYIFWNFFPIRCIIFANFEAENELIIQ